MAFRGLSNVFTQPRLSIGLVSFSCSMFSNGFSGYAEEVCLPLQRGLVGSGVGVVFL